MVDITHKSSSHRRAVASAIVSVSRPETIAAIRNSTVPKGNVFDFSRAAGLLAIKKTWEAVPDCHPLPVEAASISHALAELSIDITVEVQTIYKTGVEVEAMHGALITALTIYDMLKPIDPEVVIKEVRLVSKSGGKSDKKVSWPADLSVALFTVSEAVRSGSKPDTSGDIIAQELLRLGLTPATRMVLGESKDEIRQTVQGCLHRHQLILLTGGSGLRAADVTPEAVGPLIEREVPGLMEAIRNYGMQRTSFALLSRGVAGFAGDSLIITLPGSPRGAKESMAAIFPQILHVFRERKPEA